MPSRARVQAFVDMVERQEFIQSIPLFYAEDMTAQENNQAPRVGREAQIQNERSALARYNFERIRAASVLVDGDRVAINWVSDIVTSDGGRIRLDEIAYQTWRGDQIVHERYFYDPAQRQAQR